MDEETPQQNIVEQAKSEREALNQTLDELKAERAKLESLRAEQILSGKTTAGQPQEKPKELTPKEYAAMISRGVMP